MSGTWRRVCQLDELDPERPLGIVTSAADGSAARLCVVALDDADPVALLDRCPHRDIALSGGVVRDGELVCPGHFWRFDLRTGRRTDALSAAATTLATRVVDGWVEVLVPDPPPAASMREWLLAQAAARE